MSHLGSSTASPSPSPPAHAGSSTQPNSPRSPRSSYARPTSPDSVVQHNDPLSPPPPSQDDLDACSTSSGAASSKSSDLHDADLHPTWPRPQDLNITVSATANWKEYNLIQLELDMHWRPKTGAKRRHNPDDGDGGAQRRSRIFIYIHPERIRALSIASHERISGQDVLSFTWELSEPPVLVAPQPSMGTYVHFVPRPDSRSPQQRNTAFRSLASQKQFTLVANFPLRKLKLSIEQLEMLCNAATPTQVPPEPKIGGLCSLAKFNDTASLYWGLGAHVIEGQSLLTTATSEDIERPPPPDYFDVQGQPVSNAHALTSDVPGKKRLRTDSSGSSGSYTRGTPDEDGKQDSTVDPTMRALIAQLEQRLQQRFDASLAVLRDDFTKLRAEVMSQLDELRGELTSGLDAEEEARNLDIAETEESIMRRISEAQVAIIFDEAPRATLSFPDRW